MTFLKRFVFTIFGLIFLLLMMRHYSGESKNSKPLSYRENKTAIINNREKKSSDVNYDSILKLIQTKRANLSEKYQTANSQNRSRIIKQSRNYIKQMMVDSMFEAWKGTRYDYSGMNEEPGQGGIACGYFITTVLKHAGFDVERMALAQKKSLYIAQTLSEEIHRYPNSSTGEFVKSMKEQPNGLYVLGLSQHAGFMIVRDSALVTCHAAYYPPLEVVQEKASESKAIQNSSYKVVGRLFTDALMKKWLTKTPIETVD